MRASNAIATLKRLGLEVRVEGGKLIVRPRDRLTDDVRQFVIENRAAIVEHLQGASPSAGHLGHPQTVPVAGAPAETPLPPIQPDAVKRAQIGIRLAWHLERLAVCAEAGASPAEAARTATAETCADLETLAAEQVADWQTRLAGMRPADSAMAKLRADLIEAILFPWAATAARLGWDDLDMFGCHPAAPLVRIEAQGLALKIAASPFNRTDRAGRRHRSRVTTIDNDRATIATPTSAAFGFRRFDPARQFAVPIWTIAAMNVPALN